MFYYIQYILKAQPEDGSIEMSRSV